MLKPKDKTFDMTSYYFDISLIDNKKALRVMNNKTGATYDVPKTLLPQLYKYSTRGNLFWLLHFVNDGWSFKENFEGKCADNDLIRQLIKNVKGVHAVLGIENYSYQSLLEECLAHKIPQLNFREDATENEKSLVRVFC
jgi:hypothetical protein